MREISFPAFSIDSAQGCNFTNRFNDLNNCVNTNKKNFINFYNAPCSSQFVYTVSF